MKKLLILSGKGGTGKTTTAAAFASFSQAQAIADCDVDAPNLHLVLSKTSAPQQTPFIGGEKASVYPKLCNGCGRCVRHCRFGAIKIARGVAQIDPYACEGCGVCTLVCPNQAVCLREDEAGTLELYPEAPVFSTARLKMGRGNSGKLVTAVKFALLQTATGAPLAIIDGSPGVGCPVIASMSGVDLVLVVTEPSLSGLSDLKRIVKTARIFQTPVAVSINKWDISPETAANIAAFCAEESIPVVGQIPYDPSAGAAINAGKSLADVDCPARTALREAVDRTMNLLTEV